MKYDEAINWCEFRKFYPFLLSFEESLIKEKESSIFIPSTFSKAINYQEQLEYLNETKQKLREYRSLFLVKKEQKSIFALNKENQERTSKLEKDVKKYEKRTYELLALFTAVITFLFGSVNIFTQNSDLSLHLLIVNTLGLGFILTLFVGLILLTTPIFMQEMPFKKIIQTPRFIILLLLLGCGVMFTISYFRHPKELRLSSPQKTKEPSVLNNIVVPMHNKEANSKDTILLRNNNTVIIYKDSITH